MNFDSFITIFWMFGSGNNHFRISISDLKQRRAFSLKCFLPGNVVADLNINLLAASLSNKVDLLLIELADIDIVICTENKKNILDIPEKYLKGVEFHYVEDVADVWEFALTDEKV